MPSFTVPGFICLLPVERGYYDVVAARLISELLAYYRHRVQDEYVLVAQINGELVAVVNGRLLNKDVGMPVAGKVEIVREAEYSKNYGLGLTPGGDDFIAGLATGLLMTLHRDIGRIDCPAGPRFATVAHPSAHPIPRCSRKAGR